MTASLFLLLILSLVSHGYCQLQVRYSHLCRHCGNSLYYEDVCSAVQFLYATAQEHDKRGDSHAAIQTYHNAHREEQDAQVRCPLMYQILNNLALGHEKVLDLDRALFWYKKSLQLNPSALPTLINYGNALVDYGNIEAGFVVYKRAYSLSGDGSLYIKGATALPNVLLSIEAAAHALSNFSQQLQLLLSDPRFDG